MTSTYVQWNGNKMKLTWVSSDTLPPLSQITSALGLCLLDGRILLVDIAGRGFGPPGGHLEPGEGPEDCVRRELLEEACVRVGECRLFGYISIDHSENPLWQPGGKYPLVGYMLFYRAEIVEVLPFVREYEAVRREFVLPADLPALIPNWDPVHAAMYDAALQQSR